MIGAIAVFLTLLYLAKQLTTTNKIARVDGHRDLLKQLNTWYEQFEDPEKAICLVKGLSDFDALSPTEKLVFETCVRRYFHICEQAFYMGRDKYIPAGSYDVFMDGAVMMTMYGGESWWRQAKSSSAPDFVEMLEERRVKMSNVPPLRESFPLFNFSMQVLEDA